MEFQELARHFKSLESSSETPTLNDIHVSDLEMGSPHGEIQRPEDLSKAKSFKPDEPRPSGNGLLKGFFARFESLVSSCETPNDIHVSDLEMGPPHGEIQRPEDPPISGIRLSVPGCYLSKAKRFKPDQPRPSANTEPGSQNEPELKPPHYGEFKEAKGVPSTVRKATQAVLPAAIGSGFFVTGQGALYNPALAFSVFGVHTFGILCMFIGGGYLENKTPRLSEAIQRLGQALCVGCIILAQFPVSNKLK